MVMKSQQPEPSAAEPRNTVTKSMDSTMFICSNDYSLGFSVVSSVVFETTEMSHGDCSTPWCQLSIAGLFVLIGLVSMEFSLIFYL